MEKEKKKGGNILELTQKAFLYPWNLKKQNKKVTNVQLALLEILFTQINTTYKMLPNYIGYNQLKCNFRKLNCLKQTRCYNWSNKANKMNFDNIPQITSLSFADFTI